MNENTPENPTIRNIRRLIWLYFWLLLFEGALRKWVAPQLANPLLIIRDPVVLLIYALALQGARLSTEWLGNVNYSDRVFVFGHQLHRALVISATEQNSSSQWVWVSRELFAFAIDFPDTGGVSPGRCKALGVVVLGASGSDVATDGCAISSGP